MRCWCSVWARGVGWWVNGLVTEAFACAAESNVNRKNGAQPCLSTTAPEHLYHPDRVPWESSPVDHAEPALRGNREVCALAAVTNPSDDEGWLPRDGCQQKQQPWIKLTQRCRIRAITEASECPHQSMIMGALGACSHAGAVW
ncbi:hypothetical protein EX30DRAFT_348276 [Ascodesmis nigricans]|uniref:Secreted protein n=1 Tax=Ascodesmis nigricans TaxID=341454 RepID=A0A4S2MYN0_9PEZI|nr:hypothetical protein EX30DRAFT_348276 [Ascodesmis nigricans]